MTYLTRAVLAAIAGGVAELLLPEGDEGSGRAFGLLVSLLVLGVIAAPLIPLIGGGPEALADSAGALLAGVRYGEADYAVYRAETIDCILAAGGGSAEAAVAQQLAVQFGLAAEDLQVRLTWSADAAEEIRPAGITVLLSGQAMFANPYAIEAYLKELFGVPCTAALA